MAYHITYEKTATYEMQDYQFDSADEWYNSVLKEYKKIKAYTGIKNIDEAKMLQPTNMKSYHKELLKDALNFRMKKRYDADYGSMIFKRVIGEYKINIDDLAIVEKRMQKLSQICDILNNDEIITSKDPNPTGKAMGEMEIQNLQEVNIETAIKEALLVCAYNPNINFGVGAVMGFINKNYPQLKPQMAEISKIVPRQIKEMESKIQTKKGIDSKKLKKMIEEEFEGGEKGIQKIIDRDKPKTEELDGKLNYFFAIGDYSPENIYYELPNGDEKYIKLGALVRKMKHDKTALELLNRIRPNGPDWDESAGGNYYLVISNNPIDVATKSTGRTWASTSCENYNGAHNEGPFSDIKYGNCIVYIFTDDGKCEGWPYLFDTKKLKGRTLLRWGLKDNQEGQYAVGVERRVYPSNKTWGIPVATSIGMILNDLGFMNYKRCRTPYIYDGWSDTARGAHKHIVYEGFTMEGEKIDIQEMVYGPELNLAGSPTISYSDLHRLSRASMPIGIKRVLGQNPSVWQFPEVIGRLIRTKDLETITQLTFHSEAHPAALDSIAKILPEVSPDDWNSPRGRLWRGIIQHPNTKAETHQWIIENSPLDNILLNAYLGVLNLYDAGRVDIYSQNYLCCAPPQILDKLTSTQMLKLCHETFTKDGTGQYNGWITCLMNAPYLSPSQYQKILRFINSNYQDIYGASALLSMAIPVSKPDDWGLMGGVDDFALPNSFAVSGFTLSTSGLVPIDPLWKEKYSFDRQNPKSLVSLGKKLSELEVEFTLGKDKYKLNGYSFILLNCRSEDVYEKLLDNANKLNIDYSLFTWSFIDSKRWNSFIKNEYINDKILYDIYESLDNKEVKGLRYLDITHKALRPEMPRNIIQDLLSDGQRMKSYGVQFLGYILKSRNDFIIFEEMIMEMALTSAIWNDGDLKPLPTMEDADNLKEYFEITNSINLDILLLAAIGDGWFTGIDSNVGLANNPNLIDKLQYDMLGLAGNFPNWVEISEEYGGSYTEYLWMIQKALSTNLNVSGEVLKGLMLYGELKPDIASNPNTPVSILTGHRGGGREMSLYQEYPVEVLSNPSVPNTTFTNLWDYTIKVLKVEVNADAERLYNTFTQNRSNLLNTTGIKGRKLVMSLLGNDKNWLQYWRGGMTKSGSFSKYSNQNLYTGEGGISNYPIMEKEKKAILLKFSESDYTKNEMFYLDKIEPKGKNDILIVNGKRVYLDPETNAFTEEILNEQEYYYYDFFNYIPEDLRGKPYTLYSLKVEGRKTYKTDSKRKWKNT